MVYIVTTKINADAVQAQIDSAMGLPLEGVDTGAGIHPPHVPGGIGWSLLYAPRRALQDGSHALLADPAVQALLGALTLALPQGAVVRALLAADLPPTPPPL